MAKFKKALALVLSLAMVLTLAPLTSVNSKAAAKYKISAKTTALAAGKTYNVKVTGVQKGQYVKVARTAGLTVKYNKKTIKASKKVAGTGKALTFKVTAPGKEKAYKATIKVVIYDKNNKKVKTLSTKRKIKALPVEELKIDSVEAGTAAESGSINIIVARFSTALKSLDPSEITLRRVSDGQLYLIDKVVLSTDGKSATITLAGDASKVTYGALSFLEENVEYNFSVTQNGSIKEKVFIIPRTVANASISAVDPTNKKIKIKTVSNGTPGTEETYAVDASVSVDYFEIIGRTATVKINDKGVITALNLNNETVVEGAFKYTPAKGTTPASYKNVKTETSYSVSEAGGSANKSKYASAIYQYNNNFVDAGADLSWGRLVLNGDGSIRTVVGVAKESNTAYVSAVNGTIIKDGADKEVNLKEYTIIKDNKLIEATAVAKDDILFYTPAKKVAIVYNEKITGTVEANFKTSFTFAGKNYEVAVTNLKKATEAAYTDDEVTQAKTDKASLTLCLSPLGAATYLIGEVAAATESVYVIVTAVGTTGTGSLAGGEVMGLNPATKAIETYTYTSSATVAVPPAVGELVKITYKAADKAVTKIETQGALPEGTGFYVDGAQMAGGAGDKFLTKSNKTLGTTATDGAKLSGAKVIVLPTAALTKDTKATAFGIYDFTSWSGYLTTVNGATDKALEATTSVFGTVNESIDFIVTTAANAGTASLTAGSSFYAFCTVTETTGTDKQIKVKKANNTEVTYTTADLNPDGTFAGAKNNIIKVTLDSSGKLVYGTASIGAATKESYGVKDVGTKITLADNSVWALASDGIVVVEKDDEFTVGSIGDASTKDAVTLWAVAGSSTEAYAILIEKDTTPEVSPATAKANAEAAIATLKSAAAVTMDGTAAKYTTLKNAYTSATSAIAAYDAFDGCSAATDLTTSGKAYSDYTSAKSTYEAINAKIDALKGVLTGTIAEISTDATNAATEFCGLYVAGDEKYIVSAALATATSSASTVTVTYIDGTTSSITTGSGTFTAEDIKGTGTKA